MIFSSPMLRLVAGLLISALVTSIAQAQASPLYKPAPAFSAVDLAVIVNDSDPLSRKIAAYYQQKRQIPADQIIHVRFAPHHAFLSQSEFKKLKEHVDSLTPKHVQAFALTWLQPFRVECMSITTAFAAGFDPAFCAEGCKQTRPSPYFASEETKPYAKHNWRPTMVLAAENFNDAKALIDRGVAADFSRPQGAGYLLKTSDSARSSRAALFPGIVAKFKPFWELHYLEQDYIAGHDDVMFYFTGLTHVPHITNNRFLPGAVADHLTSAGGVMSGSSQMNVMEWLKAGATGSYGAVVEPCNFPAKFPNPGILIYHYLRGSSLIEAYWKSVAQPGQGIFVGEPLAKPFAFQDVSGKRPD
jgi:uncharacterized protein (TIGR03790 family)